MAERSAAHRVFSIGELQLNILDKVAFRGRISNSQFYSLALTCKIFLDYALDALWENMLDIFPLLLTLPPDVYLAQQEKCICVRDEDGPSKKIRVPLYVCVLCPSVWSFSNVTADASETPSGERSCSIRHVCETRQIPQFIGKGRFRVSPKG